MPQWGSLGGRGWAARAEGRRYREGLRTRLAVPPGTDGDTLPALVLRGLPLPDCQFPSNTQEVEHSVMSSRWVGSRGSSRTGSEAAGSGPADTSYGQLPPRDTGDPCFPAPHPAAVLGAGGWVGSVLPAHTIVCASSVPRVKKSFERLLCQAPDAGSVSMNPSQLQQGVQGGGGGHVFPEVA